MWAAHVAPCGLRSCITQALRCPWRRLIMRRPGCGGRRAAAAVAPAPAAGRARQLRGRDAAACAAGTGAGDTREACARRGHPDAGGRRSKDLARDGRAGRRAAAADERRRSAQGRAAVAGGRGHVHRRVPLGASLTRCQQCMQGPLKSCYSQQPRCHRPRVPYNLQFC